MIRPGNGARDMRDDEADPADDATAGDDAGGDDRRCAEDRIRRIDPATGTIIASIRAPGVGGDSGLAWAEGSLWVGHYRARRIHQVDPKAGNVLRSIGTTRLVTGVTWADGELWHGIWEGEKSDLRRIDPKTGEVLGTITMPAGTGVSGLESDDADRFFCGGKSGNVRVVRRPARGVAAACGPRFPPCEARRGP